MGNIIKPGDGDLYIVPSSEPSVTNTLSELDSLLGIGRKAIPSNLGAAFVGNNVLGLITFFLSLGILMQSPVIKAEWRNSFLHMCKAALKSIMMSIPILI